MAKRPNPTLVKYIEKHLAKGFELKHIKRKLSEVGHPIEAIEDAAAYVLSSQPKTRKKIPKDMVIYGLILMLVIAGFSYFIWFKATEQIEHVEIVKEIKNEQLYLGKSDVELIKMAASSGNIDACDFINGHNTQQACLQKYWERDDCLYERFVGGYADCISKQRKLNYDKAIATNNLSLCTDAANSVECYDNILEGKDLSFCGNDDSCRLRKSTTDADINSCDTITDDRLKSACLLQLSEFAENSSQCNEEDYLCIARTTKDVEGLKYLAETLVNQSESVSKIKVRLSIAQLSENEDFCSAYSDQVPQSKLNDVSFRNVCLFLIADRKGGPESCSIIPDQSDANTCREISAFGGCTNSTVTACRFLAEL